MSAQDERGASPIANTAPVRDTYLARTSASAEAHGRAERLMPGGT